ncbi:MAG: hypothetical protein ACK5RK_16935, partial [Betaproteobacteria bacterium]
MPLAAAGATAARPRSYLQWERRPRAQDVQQTPSALPAVEDMSGFEGFEQVEQREVDRRALAHLDDAGEVHVGARAAPQALPAASAAAPATQPPPAELPQALPARARDTEATVAPPPLRAHRAPAAAAASPARPVVKTEIVTRSVERQGPAGAAPAVPPAPAQTRETHIIKV